MHSATVQQALAAFTDLTWSQEAAWPTGELLHAATTYSRAAMQAVKEGDDVIFDEEGAQLVTASEVATRMQLINWRSAEALVRARFWHGYMLMASRPDAAYNRLGDVVRWSKPLLASLEFRSEEDFNAATNTVFVSSMAYLLAYRYLKPEARHLADKGIAVDIERTFRRVFPDQELGDRFAARIGELEARS